MKTEIGELIVGAYLKYIKNCNVISYNTRPINGGLQGLQEFDVIGFDFSNHLVYLAEVTTHISGTLYNSYEDTIEKIKDKYQNQKKYAKTHLDEFPNRIFQFWSPVVPKGRLTSELKKIKGLELIINEEYSSRIEEMIAYTEDRKYDMGNDFMRTLQILHNLKGRKIFN